MGLLGNRFAQQVQRFRRKQPHVLAAIIQRHEKGLPSMGPGTRGWYGVES